jgi:uncharacterized protein (DUF1697 family)
MKYAALLRGIGPGNPNMTNDKLRTVFEGLGLKSVQSIISSGNLIFESDAKDQAKLEADIENALKSQLGIPGRTIIRSQQQLQKLIDAKPFGDLEHGQGSYLLVTFFKQPTKIDLKMPYHPASKPYEIIAADENTLFTVTDNTAVSTTDLMAWLEKQFTKDITSRTWNTVERILKKLEP